MRDLVSRIASIYSRTLTFQKIFVELKFSPALLEKIPSIVCLVFKIENEWILKLQILFPRKTGWFKIRLWRFVLMITYNMLTQKYHFCQWFKSIFKIV